MGLLAGGALPFGRKGAIIAVLRAYFDDSGTHNPSPVAVWGGVVGTVEQFEELEARWDEMLASPFSNRPRLKAFSVGDCRWHNNEFKTYSEAESDALRYRARKIMEDAGIRAIAYSIPVKLYDSIIRGRARRDYGAPSGIAFASCADFALQISEQTRPGGVPLSCYFDKGQADQYPNLAMYIREAEGRAAAKGVPITYGFAPVAGTYGLQAADTIATEHYWYALDCLKNPNPRLKPHFQSLIKMTNPKGFTMGVEELTKMRDDYYRMYPIRDWLKNFGKKGK